MQFSVMLRARDGRIEMTPLVGLTDDYDAERGDEQNLGMSKQTRQRCGAGGGSVRPRQSMSA
jgi:hypothetical protein